MLFPGRGFTELQEGMEEIAMADSGENLSKLPKSLEGHIVPKERLELILPFVEALSETALKVGDTLPLEADAADFVRVLESQE